MTDPRISVAEAPTRIGPLTFAEGISRLNAFTYLYQSFVTVALFSFPSFAAYEDYRQRMATDAGCQAALDLEKRNRSIVSYERSFMRPVLN